MHLEYLRERIPSLTYRAAVLLDHMRRLQLNRLARHRITASQDRLIRQNYLPNTQRLMVFLTPGFDIVNGGIMSILSIAEESARLKHVHGAEVIVCTLPGDALLLKYTKFNNQYHLYRLSQIFHYFTNLQALTIHVPELGVRPFLTRCSKSDLHGMARIGDVHINVLIQNVDTLPPLEEIRTLNRFGRVTCTTAHQRYTTPELREALGMPLHKLSAFDSPEKYSRRPYRDKDNLMIVSHDDHPRKAHILKLIAARFPYMRIQVIRNISFEAYKELVSRAKWSLTFGEGLDGYFVQNIFSGGVSFAVYNPRYFTDDFKPLRTLYDSYDTLAERICTDLNDLDNEAAYADYQQQEFDLCASHYSHKQYVRNLELFYRGEYTYA